MLDEVRRRRLAAARLYTYPCRCSSSSTRARVSLFTKGLPRSTSETVARDTSQPAAMSSRAIGTIKMYRKRAADASALQHAPVRAPVLASAAWNDPNFDARGRSMKQHAPQAWLMFALAASLVLCSTGAVAANGHAAEVDPRIGTGGDGHTFPGATVPFGMIQLSPDTAMPDFKHAYKWAAGYQYGDPTIMGFSHTHFSGSGHSDLGDVLVMPIAGDVKLDPGDPAKPGSGYRSRFSHASEVEQAGYYAVTLSDYGVRAELTASTRIGWHRYTFPKGKPAHLLLDLRPSI